MKSLDYDDGKPVRIWFGNLAKYNEGKLVGKWISLPMEQSELQKQMKSVLGNDEEFQLNDWESEYEIGIHASSDPLELNGIAEILEDLDEDDKQRISFLIEHIGLSFNDALDSYEDVIPYEGDLLAVAEQLVDEGCFGEIPEPLANYIDYAAIARDLDHDGYYYDLKNNTTFYYS